MTFKDLKKRITLETAQEPNAFDRLRNKPFWIWNIAEHKQGDARTNGDCCFNHIIFDCLVTQNGNKHLWIKKATGLGK